jgi:hypothetical protein
MAKNMIITGWRDLFSTKFYSPRDMFIKRRAGGIAFLVLGAFCFVLAVNSFCLNWQFAEPTIKVIGSVEALYPSPNPWSLHRANPQVAYCYPVGTAEVHTIARVSEEVFDGLYVGKPLPVKYLPDNPTMNRIDVPAENAERQQRPYWLMAFAIFSTCFGAYALRKAYQDIKMGKTHRTPRDLGYVPDLNNRKEVRVRGWSSEDFSKILIDFRKLNDDYIEDEIAAKIDSLKDGTLRVTFPQDLPDKLFPFLINYAQYPKRFEPKAGSILVVGKALVSGDTEGNPDPKLIGQDAVFYVPSDDRKYDVVYVQVGKETFANPFASSKWKKVADPRLPAGFANLCSVRI